MKKAETVRYANYKNGSLKYNPGTHVFSLGWRDKPDFLSNAMLSQIHIGNHIVELSQYKTVAVDSIEMPKGQMLSVHLSEGPDIAPIIKFQFVLQRDRIQLCIPFREDAALIIEGELQWGDDPERSTFPCCLNRPSGTLRMGSGPAVSSIDNALFDRLSDTAMEITGHYNLKMHYDWNNHKFRMHIDTGNQYLTRKINFRIYENYFAEKFGVNYKNDSLTKPGASPPVGWMTWYAQKHKTSQQSILENANWMAKNLTPYGANFVWVDWEWYHTRNFSYEELAQVNTFSPNILRFPDGLAWLSREIKKLGLVPALWIGPSNDPNCNEMLQQHPEWILVDKPAWCGRWWIDPSNPDVVKHYIKAIFQQILNWGYEAVKWDCIPISLEIGDEFHHLFTRPELTTDEVWRAAILAAREVIGPDMYMMSCSGHHFRDITLAIDIFDGGRIGGDLFSWEDFIREAVNTVYTYLCFHNILFYADIDNVVIREEYNTIDQAISRVSFSALSGTPVTLGDNLTELDDQRVSMLKKIMPVLDIHPKDLCQKHPIGSVEIINLQIARSFGEWNVVDIFNTGFQAETIRLDLIENLHLDIGVEYLIYDFWQHTFLGLIDRYFELYLQSCTSTVLCIHKRVGHPQVISTNRHITQGGVDVLDIKWDEESSKLLGKSKIVAGDQYVISLYVPDTMYVLHVFVELEKSTIEHRMVSKDKICELSLSAEVGGDISWVVQFEEKEKENGKEHSIINC